MDLTDLDAFQQIPRVTGLLLSQDGGRLVATVSSLDVEQTRFTSALWEVDPAGERPASRLTRSPKGESGPAFTAGGDLLFCSARPDPEAKQDDDDLPAALWLLPAAGGEPRVIATRPGGVSSPVCVGDRVLVSSKTLPASTDDDDERRKARKDKKVTAILHRDHPVRWWDHDLGPDQPRLLVGTAPEVQWEDLTPEAGKALREASYDLGVDGATVVTTWQVAEPYGTSRTALVALDAGTGERRVLADEEAYEYDGPRVSPDGRLVAVVRGTRTTPTDPGDWKVVVLPIEGGRAQVLGADWDNWPTAVRWAHDGSALLVLADEQGRGPVHRLDLETDEVTKLTTDDGTYSELCVGPDGDSLYALRSSVDSLPTPVRLSARTPGAPTFLPLFDALELPGSLTEVTTTSAGGTPLRGWLVLPEGEGPHPVALWVHGGPLASWNAWSFRWCPWLLAARGWAVLLPDPSLSTGYGLDHIARGWGDWGGSPYDDILRLTDAALERPDLDADRTAMMGGSFGGYMANWIAGHTDRFRAIVTHASLWNLEQFGGTTDAAGYWGREMTSEMMTANDPSGFADEIRTPMLVVHGDKDYRVPIGDGLRLWWDLCSRAIDPAAMPHRFLYFPDENHWVLTPQHAVVWYQAVLAFLDQHVLGADEAVPDLLR